MPKPNDYKCNERILINLVLDGTFKIDGNGDIWRVKDRVKGRKPHYKIEPRLMGTVGSGGRKTIQARINGSIVGSPAARLVWQYVHGDIPSGYQINHIDGNPHNDKPSNLELATPLENIRHSINVLGRRAGRKSISEMNPLQLLVYKRLSDMGRSMSWFEEEADIGVSAIKNWGIGKNYCRRGNRELIARILVVPIKDIEDILREVSKSDEN